MPRSSAQEELARLRRAYESQKHLLEKLHKIRALFVTAYSSTQPAEKMGLEFMYAVGDVLEGQRVEDLNLRLISREEVLRELSDG